MSAAPTRTALIAGASGLVGREILSLLLADPGCATVHAVGRRPLALQHPRLTQTVADLQALPSLPRATEVYIALGTTIKVAGSQAAFRAVDLDAVLSVARAAHAQGARRLGVVSAMGADAHSRVFYNRVKGEMEEALAGIGYEALVIARPSMIDGARHTLNQPERAGERSLLPLMRLLHPLIPAHYRAIQATDVARALVQAVPAARPGVQVLLSGAMQPR